jgi:hypothetical protein
MAVSGYLNGTTAANPGFNRFYSAPATPTPVGQRVPAVASTSGTNASCNICHSSGGGTDLNAYGAAWTVQHNSGLTTAQAFLAIEGLNSDSDPTGATNIQEISANAQPGWTPGPVNTLFDIFTPTLVTQTNQSPPAIIGTLLDPAPVNHNLYANFTGYGLYTWNGSTWT